MITAILRWLRWNFARHLPAFGGPFDGKMLDTWHDEWCVSRYDSLGYYKIYCVPPARGDKYDIGGYILNRSAGRFDWISIDKWKHLGTGNILYFDDELRAERAQ